MTTMVTIGGMTVDMESPCALAGALKALRLQLVTGGVEEAIRFGEDEVRYSRANLASLDREIDKAERECAALQPGSARRRYAKRARFV
jgi:hypothetical protein